MDLPTEEEADEATVHVDVGRKLPEPTPEKCQNQSLKQPQTQRKWHLVHPLLKGKRDRPLHLAAKRA